MDHTLDIWHSPKASCRHHLPEASEEETSHIGIHICIKLSQALEGYFLYPRSRECKYHIAWLRKQKCRYESICRWRLKYPPKKYIKEKKNFPEETYGRYTTQIQRAGVWFVSKDILPNEGMEALTLTNDLACAHKRDLTNMQKQAMPRLTNLWYLELFWIKHHFLNHPSSRLMY